MAGEAISTTRPQRHAGEGRHFTAAERTPNGIELTDSVETVPSANEAYGQLKANLFIAGFTLERAFRNFLEPLLVGDGWRRCGEGFDDVNAFMDSLQLDKFRVIASDRKQIARRIKELQPAVSNRQIARTLGVDHQTINNDLGENSPATDGSSKGFRGDAGENSPPALSGRQAAVTVNRRERSGAPKNYVLQAMDFPDGQFPIVYADPPWRYENPPIGGSNRSIENHYPTMTLEEICDLPVPKIAADSAILYLWATAPKLAECFQVIDAWGFTYRTNIVWVKDKIGMGYHARSQHELLLIAKRGQLPPPAPHDRVSSVVYADRGEHSEKPDAFYELIERWYPTLPKTDLFSRQRRPGWTPWGNQVPASAS